MIEISYVNVFVSDLERALGFYSDLLGFEKRMADAEHGYASLQAGPVTLGLARVGDEHKELLGRHTGVGLAVDDLEAEYSRLSRVGVRFASPPERQPWGGFMALVEDPDGNVLYLDEVAAAHG